VLLELALLSVAYYYAFGDHCITPSPAPAAVRALLSDNQRAPHLRASLSGVRNVETLVYSLRTFLGDIFSFSDILQIGIFHVEAGEEDAGLSEPLNSLLDGECDVSAVLFHDGACGLQLPFSCNTDSNVARTNSSMVVQVALWACVMNASSANSSCFITFV
jgi:hypothetical protein